MRNRKAFPCYYRPLPPNSLGYNPVFYLHNRMQPSVHGAYCPVPAQSTVRFRAQPLQLANLLWKIDQVNSQRYVWLPRATTEGLAMMMMITSPFLIRPLAPCWLGYKLCNISQWLSPLVIFSKWNKGDAFWLSPVNVCVGIAVISVSYFRICIRAFLDRVDSASDNKILSLDLNSWKGSELLLTILSRPVVEFILPSARQRTGEISPEQCLQIIRELNILICVPLRKDTV